MTISVKSISLIQLPELPSKSVKYFIPYLSNNLHTPMYKILEPYRAFECELRKIYARQQNHEAVKDANINLVPVFTGHQQDLKIRERNLSTESEDEKSKYVMTLTNNDRKRNGDPAVVSSLKNFQQNFAVFSELSLGDLDWNNVVVAGGAVTIPLLPVAEKWLGSKKSLREYYHEHSAPASDIDVFIYGLSEEQALQKIKQIEGDIKGRIPHETTTVRTKNAITIASQYPTRHIQIVLRLYDSISEILTGFDLDCVCAAYTGDQVYASPRAIAAFVTQCNTVDLTRRSPSYENRLLKYSHRGFEVHWSLLDRSRIDPTIFEHPFGRLHGLAKLLVLETFPKASDRDRYKRQRHVAKDQRALRQQYKHTIGASLAPWKEDEMSCYQTLSIPYGPKFYARKINQLLRAKDRQLNSVNANRRKVNLHRHLCFFGTAEEVVEDCCGNCPVAMTDEETKIAEKESRIYVSGRLKFRIEDPGRQEIGSFNPTTNEEWTMMAYVGDTDRLFQAIVDGDLEKVRAWCEQRAGVNRRDFQGRTPLHLAVMVSTPKIVQVLIDHGAKLTARLSDGRTALHIAANRGSSKIVKVLMSKSLVNKGRGLKERYSTIEDTACGALQRNENSRPASMNVEDAALGDLLANSDFYDIDAIAWDFPLSPLHLAILNGHQNIIELLVSEYGADVNLPAGPKRSILAMVLALQLPTEKAGRVLKVLLKLGASPAQTDMNHCTAIHYAVGKNNHDLLSVLLSNPGTVDRNLLDNVGYTGKHFSSPLLTAIERGYQDMASKLLALGANPCVSFREWVEAFSAINVGRNFDLIYQSNEYRTSIMQPIVAAAYNEMGNTVRKLLEYGADPLTQEKSMRDILQIPRNASCSMSESVLGIIQRKLKALQQYEELSQHAPQGRDEISDCTSAHVDETYEHWSASCDYRARLNAYSRYEEERKPRSQDGFKAKKEAIKRLIQELKGAEKSLIAAGAKPFAKKLPEIQERNLHIFKQPKELPWYDPNTVEKDQYTKLFEAAWANDLESVAAVTSLPTTNLTLTISARDRNGFSPFSIAVLRGHYDLARKIVEICQTQYHTKNDTSSHKRLMAGSGDSANPRLCSTLKYETDHVLPSTMIAWRCTPQRFLGSEESGEDNRCTLLDHAVETGNMGLFEFLIHLRKEDDGEGPKISQSAFCKAIELGRNLMLIKMIGATGVGLPCKVTADGTISPLLQAAYLGNIESIDFFRSSEAKIAYEEFARQNKTDKRIRILEQAEEGVAGALRAWLNPNGKLILHCAILYGTSEQASFEHYLALVEHIVSIFPDCLEYQSAEGWTPLQIAVTTQREEVISYLISVGANQRNCDKNGRNIMHIMAHQHANGNRGSSKNLRRQINLFDKQGVKEMLLEKCTAKPGSLTPIAYWMARSTDENYKSAAIMEAFSEYSTGEDLEMLNGEGDLPLHVAVKQGLCAITSFCLTVKPSLLHRENAAGVTPLEISRDIWIASVIKSPGDISSNLSHSPGQERCNSLVNKPECSFAPPQPGEIEDYGEVGKERTYEICVRVDQRLHDEGFEEQDKRKRKLVTSFEANEVVKCIAGMKRRVGGTEKGGKPDIVSKWIQGFLDE